MKAHTLVLALALAGAIGGCASHDELSSASRNAHDAIDRADDAGARRYSGQTLQAARDDLMRARRVEDSATRDELSAREQLAQAQERDARAHRRQVVQKAVLAEDQEQLKTNREALDVTAKHSDELRGKGVPEEEVQALLSTRQSMLRMKCKSLETEISALEQELASLELVRKDCALETESAHARLKSAEERLEASRAIYAQVEERAKLARVEALDARRTALGERIEKLSP